MDYEMLHVLGIVELRQTWNNKVGDLISSINAYSSNTRAKNLLEFAESMWTTSSSQAESMILDGGKLRNLSRTCTNGASGRPDHSRFAASAIFRRTTTLS